MRATFTYSLTCSFITDIHSYTYATTMGGNVGINIFDFQTGETEPPTMCLQAPLCLLSLSLPPFSVGVKQISTGSNTDYR